MVERTSGFSPADRYLYDFNACSYARGWAQVDTEQDASYYGTWTNPEAWKIFNYAEGDTTLTCCASAEEYVIELRQLVAWNQKHGWWLGIDPGLGEAMKARFVALGLADLLH